jgi:arginyl-tRNA synthetase
MIQQRLIRILAEAAAQAAPELGLNPAELPMPELERPRAKEHGDWSTNLALVLAPKAKRPPRQVAEAIARHVEHVPPITQVDVAGPGFINLFLGPEWLHDVLREVLTKGDAYGRAEQPKGERVQVEFVSANPTGPLHVGTARNAALGDALANVMEAAAFEVQREYYFNDAGRQFDLFGESVEARYLQRFGVAAEIPEGGYGADYVKELAETIAAEHADSLLNVDPEERRKIIQTEAVQRMMDGIRETLKRFRVRMDTWASQRMLWESGAIRDVVDRLQNEGHAYEAEGAVFFKATAFGDDKDRVLIKSNGEPTYFAADCAYLLDKVGRGFDRLVYVWGADHHGDMARMHGVAQALSVDPRRMWILLYQLVHLFHGGEPVRMSRRSGDFVTLDELIDEVGADAARYTLLTRSPDSPIDFDIEAVTRQSMDNPVYYVQYAHARIASLARVAAEQGVEVRPWTEARFELLTHESELELLRKLSEFPEVVETAAATFGPHRLTRYAEEAAAAFHHFYTECRVISDDVALTQARLWLAAGAKTAVAGALTLLGVSAPESMERIGEPA